MARYLVAKKPIQVQVYYMEHHRNEWLPTRRSLITRLKNWRDESSWQEFFDIYGRLIYGVARKAGLTDDEAQDVVQATMVSVAKSMPTFKYNPAIGSFKRWLLRITRWRIIDQSRKRCLPVRPKGWLKGRETGVVEIDQVVDPNCQTLDEVWENEWEANLLQAAVAKVKRRLNPLRFQLFDFYVNQGWPPKEVAAQFNVSVQQVYLAKHRTTEMIKEEVRRLEKEVT